MKNKNTLYVLIVLILLLSSAVYILSTSNSEVERIEIKTTIKKIPVKVETPVYVPKWRTRVDTVPEFETDSFYRSIDTSAILKDYYSKYAYQDTVQVDTFGNIVISDTITKNYIIARKVQSNLEIPEITIEKTIYLNSREWYAGVEVVGSPRRLGYIGGEVLYRTKKRKVIGMGIGVNQDLTPQGSLKLLWQVK
jgi:hypothetical protein